jgi:thioredoxin-like negative regulator of GroEL
MESTTPGSSKTAAASETRPGLVFFYSTVSGRCRRVEAFLSQVLQRRHNHETFKLYRVAQEQRPDLVERFRVDDLPTLLVVQGKHVRGRLIRPRTAIDIQDFLEPWLQ